MTFVTQNDLYIFENGFTMKREKGVSPNGNPFDRKWVMRDEKDNYVDHDTYRNDLMERNDLNDNIVKL